MLVRILLLFIMLGRKSLGILLRLLDVMSIGDFWRDFLRWKKSCWISMIGRGLIDLGKSLSLRCFDGEFL